MASVLSNDEAINRYCELSEKKKKKLSAICYEETKANFKKIGFIFFQIEKFSANVPRSPVRELLEMEPETAKFR